MSRPISKEWTKNMFRGGEEYIEGVRFFVNFAKQNAPLGMTTCTCPCKKCNNAKRLTFTLVEKHLIMNGMHPMYNVWCLHGEKPGMNLTEHPMTQAVEEDVVQEENIQDEEVPLGDFIDASYGVFEGVSGGDYRGEGNDGETSRVYEPDLGNMYHEYKRIATEKLYPSCETGDTTLSVIVELHNLKKQYNWSGNSVTDLLQRLTRWIPKGNHLPVKYPSMKKMLKDLGMKANCIHACENDCILYWKDHKDATECPQCKTPRFKVKEKKSGKVGKESKEPRKVLRHFPLIPRLQRLYSIPSIARQMTWHKRANPSWDLMRHPIDSAEWRALKSKWPEFSSEGRNVWLGMATDGFNPLGNLSSSYSCWPVYTVPYNLPPSLCMKSEFQMMCLLIPGPKAPSQDIDVFLQPLVDELKQLWGEGVPTYDMDKREYFTLKAILLWGIHDFPALGNLSGCVTHGYKACPICGNDTESLKVTGKVVFPYYRRFLPDNHPYRKVKKNWFDTVEYREPPTRLSGPVLLQCLDLIKYVPGKAVVKASSRKRVLPEVDGGDAEDDHGDGNVSTSAWYKKSILFDLEYWIGHKVRHVIDVMHTEKNVAEHIINAILDKKDRTKDTITARHDMEAFQMHSDQWIHIDEVTGKQIKPPSHFALQKEEKQHFCQILKDLKLPSGFSSNLSNLVNLKPPSLHVQKSHDYHVILQYLLPVMLQHAYPNHRDLKRAIMQICLYFNIICSKVLVREHVQAAKEMIAEALCVFEHYFPPHFFDISIHLMVHLADQALLCGPSRYHWMYPFERAMKECKDVPINRRYIEGSIAEAYLVSESVKYAMEYMPIPGDLNHSSTQASFLDDNGDDFCERSMAEGKTIKLSHAQWIQIRRWILFRLDILGVDEYYSQYRSSLQATSRGKGRGPIKTEVVIQSEFIDWLHKKLMDEELMTGDLWRYVKGPMRHAKTHIKYMVNGYIFSPQYHDDTVGTQDSGVCMDAITTFRASSKDMNPKDGDTTWYGIIKEIIEVDYTDFRHVVFYCDWVNVADKANSCKLCPDSNLLMVNLKKLKNADGEYDEPVILPFEANQVFYSKDLKNPDWSIVLRSPRRMTDQVNELTVPTSFQSTLEEQPHLTPLIKCYSSRR